MFPSVCGIEVVRRKGFRPIKILKQIPKQAERRDVKQTNLPVDTHLPGRLDRVVGLPREVENGATFPATKGKSIL